VYGDLHKWKTAVYQAKKQSGQYGREHERKPEFLFNTAIDFPKTLKKRTAERASSMREGESAQWGPSVSRAGNVLLVFGFGLCSGIGFQRKNPSGDLDLGVLR
jgi:hypothetical protein